jgi:thiamine biosynthesis lipoprotein
MRLIPIAIVASVWLAIVAPAPLQDTLHRQSRRVMGSLAEIQVYDADDVSAARAMAAALDEMQRVDGLLSNYRPDSELSRMNSAAPKAPFQASPELYDFVKRSRAYFEETLGTFDPTMGPLVRAWGFFTPRPARPSAADAAAARARSGFDKVRLDDLSRSVSYAVEGIEFDPGGIGKGYAADRAVRVLQQFGITSALVSAGGSTLYGLGHPPERDGWKVAVRDPSSPATSLRFVTLRDNAVSTSGTSEKFVDVEGHRYGHIIDPRSGEPVEGMCQVSVVSPSATDSDALTKAAFILPRETLTRLFARRAGVHVLRVEGLCADRGEIWETPWSAGIFLRDAEGREPR